MAYSANFEVAIVGLASSDFDSTAQSSFKGVVSAIVCFKGVVNHMFLGCRCLRMLAATVAAVALLYALPMTSQLCLTRGPTAAVLNTGLSCVWG